VFAVDWVDTQAGVPVLRKKAKRRRGVRCGPVAFRGVFAVGWVGAQAEAPVLFKKRQRGAGLAVQFIYYLVTTIRWRYFPVKRKQRRN
jgi:hypothetical protein